MSMKRESVSYCESSAAFVRVRSLGKNSKEARKPGIERRKSFFSFRPSSSLPSVSTSPLASSRLSLSAFVERHCATLATLLVLTTTLLASGVLHAVDCNINGVEDEADVAAGTSADCNGNAVPDECEASPVEFDFDLRRVLPVATITRFVESADLDGDGDRDLVVGSWERRSSTVTTLLNDGDRQFTTAVHEFDGQIRALGLVDVDSDGDLDLAGAATDPNSLLVLLSDGAGALSEPIAAELAHLTRSVATADFDGDGSGDLVAVDSPGDRLSLARGHGDGTFAEPIFLAVGEDPVLVVTADFDRDGRPDLATANRRSTSYSVLLNEGAGSFARGIDYPLAGTSPLALRAADVDGDGAVDLVATVAGGLSVLLNAGDGSFLDTMDFTKTSGHSFALGDFDGDTDLDVAAATARSLWIVRNDGRGRFNVEHQVRHLLDDVAVAAAGLSSGAGIAAADYDGNGLDDLAYLVGDRSGVRLLWGTEITRRENGRGPVEMRPETIPVGPLCGDDCRPHSGAVADVDNDGDLDAVVFVPPQELIVVRNENGLLVPTTTIRGNFRPDSIAAGDLDGDGNVDIALAGPRSVFRGDGAGDFEVTGGVSTVPDVLRIRLADFDADGNLDFAAAGDGVSIQLGNGEMQFTVHPDQDERVLRRAGVRAVTPIDADGDGTLDLAVGHMGATNVSLLRGVGDGTFTATENTYSMPSSVVDLAAGDMNGDGSADIAAAGGSGVSVFLSRGNGRFRTGRTFQASSHLFSLVVHDIDLDGALDVVTSASPQSVSVLLGHGDGELGQPRGFSTGQQPVVVRAGDFDLDGDTDLISFDKSGGTLTVLYNESQLPETIGPEGHNAYGVCTAVDFQRLAGILDGEPLGPALSYVLPRGGAAPLATPLFFDAQRYPTHAAFLRDAFAEVYGALTPEDYRALVSGGGDGALAVGDIVRRRTTEGLRYGFTLFAQWHDSIPPAVRAAEVKQVYEELRGVFRLEPFVYLPATPAARAAAASWTDPGFPIDFVELGSQPDYEAYTEGVAYGWVRVLDASEVGGATARCELDAEDIVVLRGKIFDLEPVTAAVVTTDPQDTASHLAVRTNRRGTPNAYAPDGAEQLSPLDGRFARLEVRADGYRVEEVPKAEERDQNPAPAPPPEAAGEFAELPSLAEIALLKDAEPGMSVSRFGLRAAGLVAAQRLLGDDVRLRREIGLAIPAHHFLGFLRTNRIASALDPAREVTYEEFTRELQTLDAALRCEALNTLRVHMRRESVVNPALTTGVANRAAEIFGAAPWPLELLPSATSDLPLSHGTAGLYDQTVAAGADELADAFRVVWSSLFSVEATGERAFAGIADGLAAMAILVVPAGEAPRAHGKLLTDNPANPLRGHFVVTAQPGGLAVTDSVTDSATEAAPETSFVRIRDDDVDVERKTSSDLLPRSSIVLSEEEMLVLAGVARDLEESFPLEQLLGPGAGEAKLVALEIAFRLEREGRFTIETVTPFRLTNPPTPTPTFELVVPDMTICGVFAQATVTRGLREELELKSRVRLRAGVLELPTVDAAFEAELFDSVRFGAAQDLGFAEGPGEFRLLTLPGPGGETAYRFTFVQAFDVGQGRTLELQLVAPLTFRTQNGISAEPQLTLDEEYFTTTVSREALQGILDGEPLVRYGSCTHSLLDRFEITAEVEIAGGDTARLRLEERLREADNLLLTGPASLQHAEVEISGERQVVSDYWRLGYSADRHNTRARYAVVLEPPVTLSRLAGAVHFVRLDAPAPEFDVHESRVFLLGEDFQILAAPSVTSYDRALAPREPAPPDDGPRFRRGDANADGRIDLIDALAVLRHLFERGTAVGCQKAADANDDGRVNILDPLAVSGRLLGRLRAFPEPASECGEDPTPDGLSCSSSCQS